jgi:hypothetical protein
MILMVSSIFLTLSGCHWVEKPENEERIVSQKESAVESVGELPFPSVQDRFSSPESESLLSSVEELMKLTMELNRQLSEQQWERMDSLVKSYQEEFHAVMDLMTAEEQNDFHVFIRNYISIRERVMASDSAHD